MVEVLPTDRLTRKRNTNLQKQLELTLQILSEEYRQTKERLYKDERECGQFLQSLHHTVPGLQAYGQPDTRAMNTNALLRERRYSVSTLHSAVDSDSDDDTPLQRLAAAGIYPDTARPRTGHRAHGGGHGAHGRGHGAHGGGHGGRHREGKRGHSPAGDGVGHGSQRPGFDMFRKVSSASGRESPTRTNSAVTAGAGPAGGKARARPSTAGPSRPVTSGGFATGRDHHGHKRRPATGLDHHRDVSSRFGKNAYTQEDRVSHDQILNKFNNIFDPNTRPKKVNLTPNATPIVVIDPGHEDGAFTNSTGHAQSVVNGINDAGHHFGPDLKKTAASRRVVWSAQPAKRRVGVVSAPNSARGQRPPPPNRATTPGGKVKQGSGTDNPPQTQKHPHFQPVIKLMGPQGPSTAQHTRHHVESSVPPNSHTLHVPGEQTHAHNPDAHHHAKHCHAGGPPVTQKHAHPPRPASRLSEASDVTHNPDFVNKLLHAGEKQGEKKRPKTAPPKYELIVRSMPAPRQTVVGILAQIENRKADMRAMLNTSKELQKSIKKLVPREKLIETEDSD